MPKYFEHAIIVRGIGFLSHNLVKAAKFRDGFIYQIFELIGPPRPNTDNPTPCQFILMQRTEQGGRGRPVVSIILEYMGMVLDCPCLALEVQLVQKSLQGPRRNLVVP